MYIRNTRKELNMNLQARKIIISLVTLIVINGCSLNSSLNKDATSKVKQDLQNEIDQMSKRENIPITTEETKNSQLESDESKTTATSEEQSYQMDETEIEKSVDYWRVIATNSDYANIRKSPSYTSSTVVTTVDNGADVSYLHTKYFDPADNRTWYKVQTADGIIGWISKVLVAESDGRYYGVTPEENDYITTVTTNTSSNIRNSPSIDGDVVISVSPNTELTFLGETKYDSTDGRTWYLVLSPTGELGWISKKVIQ